MRYFFTQFKSQSQTLLYVLGILFVEPGLVCVPILSVTVPRLNLKMTLPKGTADGFGNTTSKNQIKIGSS